MRPQGEGKDFPRLNSTDKMAINKIKVVLLNVPALALPDVTKPFHVYMNKKEMATGVLMQTLGPWKRPPCHQIIAATALLVRLTQAKFGANS